MADSTSVAASKLGEPVCHHAVSVFDAPPTMAVMVESNKLPVIDRQPKRIGRRRVLALDADHDALPAVVDKVHGASSATKAGVDGNGRTA